MSRMKIHTIKFLSVLGLGFVIAALAATATQAQEVKSGTLYGDMQLVTQDGRDVGLDPDRAAIAVVRGTIGAFLAGAHVAVGTAVDAAHVRVQGPAERHADRPVQGGLAGLFAIDRRGCHRTNVLHDTRAEAPWQPVHGIDGGLTGPP